MKFSSIVSCLLVLLITELCNGATEAASSKVSPTKAVEKLSYPKKVSSIKKRPSKTSLKKVADITDKFKDLPADDLAFIKELDKQFKLHGGKVKIKVQNDNATESKNSKRTIEGELGYGYSHNGYDYNPPKYMFYPYSQQNIAHDAPKYYVSGEDKTEVSIEPSYSYELKPQTYITHNEQQQLDVPQQEAEHQQQHHHHQEQQQQVQQHPQQHYEEPVIVLRIPGPAKYATHLQTLLQQYLEIRAAQYLRILEEAEQRKLQHHQQQHAQQHQLQQLDYGHSASAAAAGGAAEQEEHYQQQQQIPEHHQQHDYQQQVEYEHQNAVTPQPVQYDHHEGAGAPQAIQYPEIDNVYHSYKHRHPSHPEQAQQPHPDQQAYYVPQQQQQQQHNEEEEQQPQQHIEQQHQQYHHHHQQQQQQHEQQEQPQFYYTHQQEYAQPEGPPANTYQHVYLVSMAPHSHPGYEESHVHQPEQQQQPIYVPEQVQHQEHSSLPISENNPRASHTKVVFTHNTEHAGGVDYQYQLPSIQPNDRHAPTSVPDYHQDFQPSEHQQYQHALHAQQESQESVHNYQQQVVSTVEPAAHDVVAITQRPFNFHAKSRARGRTSHKRRAASLKEADHGLQKIRDYVREKLGAETGSAVEYKTTQVIDG